VVVAQSHFKLPWLDELITLHIARQGSAGAIWNALAQGADPNPPLTHLLVHFSRILFGDHELAYRLPAFIGYWVGMVSLFAYY
jgi:4-amino-4-deoxy-L-arabinose transferase-like glycosyltransferase